MSENWANRFAGDQVAADDAVSDPWEDHGRGTPLLARGVRWSDVVADIERDNQLRDAA
jgi:hypothetical protein